MDSAHLDRRGPLYEQVARMVHHNIGIGALQPGDRVPSLRNLSRKLNVSIATVTQAYINLEDRGVIESRPKSGYYVRRNPRAEPAVPVSTAPRPRPRKVKLRDNVESFFSLAHQPGVLSLGVANPAAELMPVKALTRALRQVASAHSEASIDYCFPPGDRELRRQIAFRTADLGYHSDPNDIVVTTGCTEALNISLQAVAAPGAVIAVESPSYHIMLQMIERLGMLAVEVRTDPDEGISIEALEKTMDEVEVAAVALVPNFGNPLGSLMPDANKRALVELLSRRGVPLIEDDIYGDIYFGDHRPSTCKAYDRDGTVITCSSFSKTVAPGYRVGWIMTERYRSRVIEGKHLTSEATTTLPQMAIAEFLKTGHYDRHLMRLRRAYQNQVERYRYAIAEHFPAGIRITRPQGGFVLWVQLPRGSNSLTLCQRAFELGISVTPGTLFSATPKYRNFVRICAGNPFSNVVENAIKAVGRLAAENT